MAEIAEAGYTAIPIVDYRPYTELPPEERKQVEEFLESMKQKRKEKIS